MLKSGDYLAYVLANSCNLQMTFIWSFVYGCLENTLSIVNCPFLLCHGYHHLLRKWPVLFVLAFGISEPFVKEKK